MRKTNLILRRQLQRLISRSEYVCAHRYDAGSPVGTREMAVGDLRAETERAKRLLMQTAKSSRNLGRAPLTA